MEQVAQGLSVLLNVITAFAGEAAPIIRELGLQPVRTDRGCRVYEGVGIRLGISGMGHGPAKQMAGYLLSLGQAERMDWLNIGIAGTADWKVGTMVVARSVAEYPAGRTWKLNTKPGVTLPPVAVRSVQDVAQQYDRGFVYEMEASGILSALPVTMHDRVYCIKLISDGPDNPVGTLTRTAWLTLIEEAKDDILRCVNQIVQPTV
ncbi:MAG: hypothetical protein OXG56_10125 [Gammaproteobacteria bacterium]|nr:hypothetical protein [Gammaproteobacteria bacterium]